MARPNENEPATAAQRDPFGYDATAIRRRPQLRWTDAQGAHTVALEDRGVLGCAASVDLVVDDPAVSRLHAELEPRADGLWVRDLGSTNGTFVEGVRVASACIPPGGTLRVGGTDLRVTYAAEATAVAQWPDDHFGPLVGPSAAMRELYARLARAAGTESTVLIQGETGTGKELVARALHDASPRAGGPFVIVDCGALPENLLEAELFGHARGAFTGAADARAGAIEAADGGTVFLDEVGELSLAMQPRLLRAIESRTVRRLGETAHRKVDVRFVSATHRDLRTMVNAHGFRDDLYFRLAVLPLTTPPLRARPTDIPALVRHFLPAAAARSISPELMRELTARPWYGNVRELRNFVERALAFGAEDALSMDAAGRAPLEYGAQHGGPMPGPMLDLPFKDLRDQWLQKLERDYVAGLLARHQRNVSAVAQAAGLNRTYVHKLIKRHGL